MNNGMRKRREAIFSATDSDSGQWSRQRRSFYHEEDDELFPRLRYRRDEEDEDSRDGVSSGPEDVRGIGEDGKGTNLHALNLNTSRPTGARGRRPEAGKFNLVSYELTRLTRVKLSLLMSKARFD